MTFDGRTEKNLATLDPKAVAKFRPFIDVAKQIAGDHGTSYIVISGNRTWAEQNALYAIGRTVPAPAIRTHARGGQSNHNFGIAIDGGIFRRGKYLDNDNPQLASRVHTLIGKQAKKHGLEWGGEWTRFKDFPHIEVRTGLTLAQKRARFAKFGSVL